MKRWL